MAFALTPARSTPSSFITSPSGVTLPPGGRGVTPASFIDSFIGGGRPALISPNFNFSFKIGNPGKGGSSSSSDPGGKGGSGNRKGNGKSGNGPRGGRPHRNAKTPFYESPERSVSQVSWTTGISSGVLVNPMQGGSDEYTPLFILNGQIFPDSKGNNSLTSGLLGKDIYFDYLMAAQSAVNYKVGEKFRQDDFFKYVNSLSNALQLYYMVDSILSYSHNPTNSNRGMLHLRQLIDSDILSSHNRLQLFLEKLSVPSNLLNFIRYFYQNFSYSGVHGSPICRLGFKGSLYDCNSVDNGKLDSVLYNNVLNDLFDSSNLISILNKTFKNQIIGKMPPSSSEAIFDEQFLTFWHNSNITFSDKARPIVHSRAVLNHTETFQYGTFAEELDGSIYASCSIICNNRSEPGLWQSFSNFESDWEHTDKISLSVYKNNTIQGCASSSHRLASGIYSSPVFTGNEWILITGFAPGVRSVQTSSIENVTQAISMTIRHLLQSDGSGSHTDIETDFKDGNQN